jgi:hypothetical protein
MATGINISIGADGSPAVRELKKVGKAVKKVGTDTVASNKRSVGSWTELSSKIQIARQVYGKILQVLRPVTDLLRDSVGATSRLADQTAKMARNVGTSAESLQTLSFAAGRAGVDSTSLNNGLKRLSRNMVDSISGNTRMADTFEAIGIKVKNADGSLRNVEDVFKDLSNVSRDLGESAEGTGLRMLLLGRGGAELGNLMMAGSDGVDAMEARLDSLRGRMSGELLTASEDYQDSMLDLQVAIQGVRNELGEHFIPIADETVQRLTNMAVGASLLVDELDSGSSGGLVGSLGLMYDWMVKLNPFLLQASLFWDGMAKAAGMLEEKGTDARKAIAPPDLDVARFFVPKKDRRAEVSNALGRMGGGSAGGESPEDKAAKAEAKRAAMIDNQIRSMERRVRLAAVDVETQIELNQMFAEEDIRRRLAAKEINAAEAERIRLVSVQIALMDEAAFRKAEAIGAAKEEAELLRLLRSEELEHAAEMTRLDEKRAADRVSIMEASVSAVGDLLAVGVDVADKLYKKEKGANVSAAKKAFEVRKAFAVGQATINAALAVTNAIATAPNFIVGAIQAAVAGGLGIAQIAVIAAEQPSFGDAGLMPFGSLRDTHRSAVIRNDEMVVDPRGTRDISAMFAMMRRGMEANSGTASNQITTHVVLDGSIVATSVENTMLDRIERGDDFRQRARV